MDTVDSALSITMELVTNCMTWLSVYKHDQITDSVQVLITYCIYSQ